MRSWCLGWILTAVLLSGCTLELSVPSVGSGPESATSFSLSVGRAAGPATRMSDATVQSSGIASFRGIEQVYVIPFSRIGAVAPGDVRFGMNLYLPQEGIPAGQFASDAGGGDFPGLVLNNNSHLYQGVFIKKGTGSVLVYGKAIDDAVGAWSDSVLFKSRNGLLRAHGLETASTPAGISFDPCRMLEGTVPERLEAELSGILSYLTNLAQASVTAGETTLRWDFPEGYGEHEGLLETFRYLTFRNKPFCCSSENLGEVLTNVYRTVYSIQSALPSGPLRSLCQEILERAAGSRLVEVTGSGLSATLSLPSPFPTNYGLPAGSVTVQWDGNGFIRPGRASGSGAVSLEAFCYPPSLWYYVNSPLAASEEDLSGEYRSDNRTWDSIADQYPSVTVTSGTRSVAVRYPLQYGVSLLEARLNLCGADILYDSRSNPVRVDRACFPLTGVIIGDQKAQSYAFTPAGTERYYIFDREVGKDSAPKVWLASRGVSNAAVRVLALQTEPEKDIHVALEFRNESGNPFYGHEGDVILPGSRFYLFGILEYERAVNRTTSLLPSVFYQDHTTYASFTVSSLEEAYSTIPELTDPQLQLGVEADLEWILSTPVVLPVQ